MLRSLRRIASLVALAASAWSAGPRAALGEDAAASVAEAVAALGAGKLDDARRLADRAIERDPGSLAAWEVRARWAEAAGSKDEAAFSLHRAWRLSVAQRAPKPESTALRARLDAADPVARDLSAMTATFVARLAPVAERLEKERRRHAAIRVHRQILALDPERGESLAAIDRIAADPDPSLAESAKPKDLLADVSADWIAAHDSKHATWDSASRLERENYTTITDAGYEVMVRSAEAMEHMNAFYRRFFRYGADGKGSVPRIELRIFRSRDEYLKLGRNPPEWSGGQFTGGSVETFVGPDGFSGTVGTLFHEAAHQFVSLATNAAGWLNEGLASYFEGSRMLANGSVRTNLPANHRLFPLASRMERGWMSAPDDGIPAGSTAEPEKAPTFRIVVENRYPWGPPWYAPTWGVVYFCWNYQDPADGRFLYRAAFQEFIDSSGGKTGKSAVENFEKVVLASAAKPTPGFRRPDGVPAPALPRTIDELDPVWREWTLRLRDEQSGKAAQQRPFLTWARCALLRKCPDEAIEHFEAGLEASPHDVDLNVEFAELLASRGGADRAAKLALHAHRVLLAAPKADPARIASVEALLHRCDPTLRQLDRIADDLAAAATRVADAYAAAGLPLMTMDVTRRFGAELGVPDMDRRFEAACRIAPRPLALWTCAYDGGSLRGWSAGASSAWKAEGEDLAARFGAWQPGRFEFAVLTLERATSGDYSIEAEVRAEAGKSAFAGIVFGQKGAGAFHALLMMPGGAGGEAKPGESASSYVDLTSFFGSGDYRIWRHNPVGRGLAGWHRLRLDVAGGIADAWFDGELVASQDFGSRDVVGGTFGLVSGVGESRFRNVRFLARERGDTSGMIERSIRMEKLRAKGGPVGGSWVGQSPPFPEGVTWVRGSRTSWGEKGPVPTLLVFWSVKQEKLVPIRAWLQEFAQAHADIGLEVISVSQPDDRAKVEQHLSYESFPGAVAIDAFADASARFGRTFSQYLVGEKYGLPRTILLDVDGTVLWEGDPGFKPDTPYKPGSRSLLDAPMETLRARRKLVEVAAWRREWGQRGRAAALDGDFAACRELLVRAAALPSPEPFPDLAAAAGAMTRFGAIAETPDALAAFASELSSVGADPAMQVVLDWAKSMKLAPKPPSKVTALLASEAAKAWRDILHRAESLGRAPLPERNEAALRDLAERAAAAPGMFPSRLAAIVSAALDAGDAAGAWQACADARRIPARWLLRERLGAVSR